uniref:Uncharacterized protein n=1 Tax=Clastoptera arizonana TaxID=38151 RepID=A0A1B6ECD1_9HEMI
MHSTYLNMECKILLFAVLAVVMVLTSAEVDVLSDAAFDGNDNEFDIIRKYHRMSPLDLKVKATRRPTTPRPTLGPNPHPTPAPVEPVFQLKGKKVITIEEYEVVEK